MPSFVLIHAIVNAAANDVAGIACQSRLNEIEVGIRPYAAYASGLITGRLLCCFCIILFFLSQSLAHQFSRKMSLLGNRYPASRPFSTGSSGHFHSCSPVQPFEDIPGTVTISSHKKTIAHLRPFTFRPSMLCLRNDVAFRSI
ncbi:hypothetical protein V8C35DRAFT_308163 [Trichoderma chlorosporum]